MAQVGANMEYQEYKWAYSIMDSSRVSACLISMLLIVYGSFRSLNMEREAREKAEREKEASLLGNKTACTDVEHYASAMLPARLFCCAARHVLFLRLCSNTLIACAALAFLLTPLCQYVAGGSGRGAVCGRYSAPELAAALVAAAIVSVNGHGIVRYIYSTDSTALAEGLHSAAHWAVALRRLLGLLLLLHIHHQCHGQSCHEARGESDERGSTTVATGRCHEGRAQAVAPGQARVPLHASSGTLLYA
ncbi:unnamed protein product [Leptidea sinapis]|uniref:Uncharacterized protein n=1 Tax=Leptidea sinapis TaxID=189913 RepID=A0A5E4PZ69_9NEOP|nr:unnamed protein product [Leptidea sinapis]